MLAVLVFSFAPLVWGLVPQAAAAPDTLSAAVDTLGVFDLAARTSAARTLRRANPETVAPLLDRAARQHRDSYTRFRAFVLLAGLDASATARLARDLVRDRDDRVRTVAYQWFESHRDAGVLPTLLEALPKETSQFVRPALTRTLAAYGDDVRVRQALAPLVNRGEDLFRGSVIEALGTYKATYALSDIIAVAKLEGPLQDDAIAAIGWMGDAEGRAALATLQSSAPRELQPDVSAALCLLGVDCAAREAFLRQTLDFAATTDGYQPLLRSAVRGLGLLALSGRTEALSALFAAAAPSRAEPVRESIALGIGLVALRAPQTLLQALQDEAQLDGPIGLLLDAFDMLSEDFAEEQFYVEIRRAFWAAPEGSMRRRTAEALIQKLEF